MMRNKESGTNIGFWQVLQSIVGAAFGVQSRRRREGDFTSSSPLPFIVGGLLFTAVFIGVLLFFVGLSAG